MGRGYDQKVPLVCSTIMYMSTSYNKGIYATTSVQCAAACKWLQPGSGLVDAFLTGLVDACVNLPRGAPTLGE